MSKAKQRIYSVLILGFEVIISVITIWNYISFTKLDFYNQMFYFMKVDQLSKWEQFEEIEEVEYNSGSGISYLILNYGKVRLKTSYGSQTIGFDDYEPIRIYYDVNETLYLMMEQERELERRVRVIGVIGMGREYLITDITEAEGELIERVELQEIIGISTEDIIKVLEKKAEEIETMLDILYQKEIKVKLAQLLAKLGSLWIITLLMWRKKIFSNLKGFLLLILIIYLFGYWWMNIDGV